MQTEAVLAAASSALTIITKHFKKGKKKRTGGKANI